MSNADNKAIKVGGIRLYIGATKLGVVGAKDFEFNDGTEVITASNSESGVGTVKAWTNGGIPTMKITFNDETKHTLARIYNHIESLNINPADYSAGTLRGRSEVGRIIKPYTITAYLIHWDDNNTKYGADNLNPYSWQLGRAYTDEPLTWNFPAGEHSSREITFKGHTDEDNDLLSYQVGFISLPSPELYYIRVTNGGTGYTSAPTVGFTGGGGGSGATATAYLTGGSVTSVVITNAGTGYTEAPTVTFTGGAGTGAAATAYIG